MNENNQVCEHQWQRKGLWDGVTQKGQRTGGPVTVCILCSQEQRFNWEDWSALPAEKKAELSSKPDSA